MKEAPGTSSQATGQHIELERFRNYLRFLADIKLDRRLRSRVDPSDIVQETLLRAYDARDAFRRTDSGQHVAWLRRNQAVGMGFGLGSILATLPLVIAVLYHRWANGVPSILDEMALLTVTITMLVTGLSWKIKATTLWGGTALTLYLIVLIASLAYRPQVAIGVYMAVGGAIVFAIGIVLSIYRDKLLEIPEQVANRQGIFRILNWR